MKTFTKIFLTLFIVNSSILVSKSQNTAITDDSGYSPNSSAMLDVKSTDKGVLIPRLTTAQRIAVLSPATGLLVFDSEENSFYFYNGTSWVNLSSDNANGIIGYTASDKVYLKDVNNNFGVGTTSPTNKLEVKADADNGINQAIFNVVNNSGDTVFAVYPQGVRINVYDDPLVKAQSSKGGFAVGGFKPAKGTMTNEYLRITPDSIRMYFEEVPAGKAASSKGGFAVGGFKPAKAGVISDVLTITNESTKIYTTDPDVGFGVEDAAGSGYMKLTPENYFIGHQAGEIISTGKHNTFLGYQAGASNTEGWDNIFVGYQAGFSNVGYSTTKGANNIFIGNKAGYNNKGAAFGEYGHDNIFIGKEAGFNNVNGPGNLFIGVNAGFNNIGSSSNDGGYNVFIGNQAGFANKSGASNVYVGLEAGKTDTSGSGNAYVGQYAGRESFGHSNSFIGNSAGGNLKGNGNACFGSYAGYTDPLSHDVNNNTLIGYSAGQWIVTGGGNTILGNNAGYYFDEGDNNVFIGTESGKGNGSGLNNPGSGNIFLGYQSGFWETGDNKLYIENSNSLSPLIFGDFATNDVVINGNLKATGILYDDDGDAGTSGQVLSSVGTGTNWITPTVSSFSGSGSSNYIAKFTATETVGNSIVYDNGSSVGIGTISPVANFTVQGTAQSASIPTGGSSTGVFRIAIAANEGIDFGQMAAAPYSAWMQVGYNGGAEHLAIQPLGGNVGIGTVSPDKLLTVNGDARVTGNIYYGASGSTTTYTKPDFVFKSNYDKNYSIDEIEEFINKNNHLPWLTSAKDEKEGINMTRMTFETLEAVENIQLQLIELKKYNETLLEMLLNKEKELKAMKNEIENINKKINK